MTAEPQRLVQRQLDAYNAHNLNDFLACYAEDVCVRELATNEVIAQGKSAMHDLYTALFESRPLLHAKVLTRIVEGNTVVDHEEVEGLNDTIERTVAIYRIEDARIQDVWFA